MNKLMSKIKSVAVAALTMGLALGAQAADVAVAVKSTDEKTLTFYYKDASETNQLEGTVYVVPETVAVRFDIPWHVLNNNPVTNVVFDASFAAYRPKSTLYWFFRFTALTGITNIQYLDTSSVTNMMYMFYDCSALTALDVSHFNTANVSDMMGMFGSCSSLTSLDVSNFNTANVTRMLSMFSKCSSLTSLDVSNFDTANVTTMNSMFQECTDLTTICASDAFKTNQVTNSKNMFNSSTALVGGNGTKWADANPKDMTYARIDGVNGLPGYFTRGSTTITIADVTGATAQVYTNDTVEIAGPPYKVLVDATDVKVVYTAADNYMFPGGYKTFTTNVTAKGSKMTVALTAEQQPIDAVANPNCLTFSAADDFGIKMWNAGSPTVNPSLEYSTDQIYWETFDKEKGAAAGPDHKLYLRGLGNSAFASSATKYYSFTNTFESAATAIACSGNIETLLDYQTVAKGEHPSMADFAFCGLFSDFAALTTAPELPAKSLTNCCYVRMFMNCTSLTETPELPAMTLATSCYGNMFQSCTSLTDLPDLPATNLQLTCYVLMFGGCTSLVVNTNAPGKAWSIPAEAATSAESASNWNKNMFNGTPGDITNVAVTCGTPYYIASALVPVTVVLPEVAGATAQLYTFYTQGGWKSVATNEVPSNATVRVVWTAADGKAWENGVYVWSRELKATESVQTAPAPATPTVWDGSESSVTLNIDTRTKKSYFEKDDILPIWYAAGAEVKVKGEGEQSWETLVKSSATTNTVAWLPDSIGVYDFSHTALGSAQIIYTTPVEVTTNDLEVSGTTVAVTADGSPIEPQTEEPYAGKLMVASNSTVTATWTATGSGVYFADGSTTYTQTFEAGQSVNPVSEVVTKPEEPKAPKLLLGVVAQRYPWDGKIDVQYWAKNTPNEGYTITITVTLPDGTTASETKPCLNGKNVTDFDARAKFGEVQFPKGVKVKATLEKK